MTSVIPDGDKPIRDRQQNEAPLSSGDSGFRYAAPE
jgi:hypothetical protein